MKLSVSEIFSRASAMSDKDERIAFMRMHFGKAVATVIKFALDPEIKWLLPEGKPPYKPNEAVESQGLLHHYATKLWIFVDGVDPPSATDWLTKVNIKPNRREMLFLQYLEAIDPADAKLLCAVKDKHMPYKFLSEKFVRECFPGLLSESKEQPKEEKKEKPKKPKKLPKARAIKEDLPERPPVDPSKVVDIDAVLASN